MLSSGRSSRPSMIRIRNDLIILAFSARTSFLNNVINVMKFREVKRTKLVYRGALIVLALGMNSE